MARRLGVCSWSLRAASAGELAERVVGVGCHAVQIHLNPFLEGWRVGDTARTLEAAGVRTVSGMMTMLGEDYTTLESIRGTGGVRPSATWPENLRVAGAIAPVARDMGVSLVTFHAGYLPHDPADAERSAMMDRLATLRDVFGARGVQIALETGQETAETLLVVLDELAGVAVNFDPANMILYGMGDPCEALACLGPRVAQVHVKDAVAADRPGAWGAEVRVGTGAVPWARFFEIARSVCPDADMMIEREAGEDRAADIRAAREVVERLGGVRP